MIIKFVKRLSRIFPWSTVYGQWYILTYLLLTNLFTWPVHQRDFGWKQQNRIMLCYSERSLATVVKYYIMVIKCTTIANHLSSFCLTYHFMSHYHSSWPTVPTTTVLTVGAQSIACAQSIARRPSTYVIMGKKCKFRKFLFGNIKKEEFARRFFKKTV